MLIAGKVDTSTFWLYIIVDTVPVPEAFVNALKTRPTGGRLSSPIIAPTLLHCAPDVVPMLSTLYQLPVIT